jgi:hypothetical protein
VQVSLQGIDGGAAASSVVMHSLIHATIVNDIIRTRRTGRRPRP